LDKNANRNENREQKVIQKPLEGIAVPIAPEYGDAFDSVSKEIESWRLKRLDAIKENTKPMSTKKMLSQISEFADVSCMLTKEAILATLAVDYLYKRISILEDIILRIVMTMGSLPQRGEIEKLLKVSAQMEHIDAIVSALQTNYRPKENKSNEREKYIS
jgi:hypothetical protein